MKKVVQKVVPMNICFISFALRLYKMQHNNYQKSLWCFFLSGTVFLCIFRTTKILT